MEMLQLDSLTEEARELFKKTIQRFLRVTYILEKRYHRDKNLYRDPLYSFTEEYESMVREYLKLSGFDLINDSNNGVYYIESEDFNNNLNFSKLTTIFLLLTRLLYEEKQESVNIGLFTTFHFSELLSKIDAFHLSTNLLHENKQREALRVLAKYNFIEKIEGSYTEPSSIYVIYPSILHCIDGNIVRNILEEFKVKDNSVQEIIDIAEEIDEIFN